MHDCRPLVGQHLGLQQTVGKHILEAREGCITAHILVAFAELHEFNVVAQAITEHT